MFKQLADVSLKSLDMINKNAEKGLNKLAGIFKRYAITIKMQWLLKF